MIEKGRWKCSSADLFFLCMMKILFLLSLHMMGDSCAKGYITFSMHSSAEYVLYPGNKH